MKAAAVENPGIPPRPRRRRLPRSPERDPGASQASSPLPSLTARQQAFAIAYVACGAATEAYRQSYDATGMSPETLRKEAWRVLHRPDVQAAIAVIGQPAIEQAQITKTLITQQLARIAQEAHVCGDFRSAIRALELLGKDFGMFKGSQLSPGEDYRNMTTEELLERYDQCEPLANAMRASLSKNR